MRVMVWKVQRQINKEKSFGKDTGKEKGQEAVIWVPIL